MMITTMIRVSEEEEDGKENNRDNDDGVKKVME